MRQFIKTCDLRNIIDDIACDEKLSLIKPAGISTNNNINLYYLQLKKTSQQHPIIIKKNGPRTKSSNGLVTNPYPILTVFKMLDEINNQLGDQEVIPEIVEASTWAGATINLTDDENLKEFFSENELRKKVGYSFSFKSKKSIEHFLRVLIQYIESGIILQVESRKFFRTNKKNVKLKEIYNLALKSQHSRGQNSADALKSPFSLNKKEIHAVSAKAEDNVTQEEISYDLQKEEVEEYIEGETRLIQSQHRSRVSGLRNDVLANADYRCQLCCRTMSEIYGKEIDGKETKTLLHAHHIIPLSQGEGARSVNPKTDLIAVCPSCHAILHISGNKEAIPRERFYELRQKIVGNLQKQENIDIMNLACDEISKKEKNENAN